MTPSPHDSLGFLVHDVARLMRWHFDRRAQAVGLTRAQWSVLVLLLREDGVQQKCLAELLDIAPISLSGLLDRLERDGWVERRDDPADRRAKRVYRTAKLGPVLESLRALGAEVRESALQGLSAEEQEQLLDLLQRVRRNLGEAKSGKSK